MDINEYAAPGDITTVEREGAVSDSNQEVPHLGHFSRISGTYWCDTCESPYCDLA